MNDFLYSTVNWIKEDWPSGCLPSDEAWNDIWHNNVRFACIVNNEASEFKTVDYTGLIINKDRKSTRLNSSHT